MSKTAVASARVQAFVRSRLPAVSEFGPISEGEESQAFSFNSDGNPRVIRVGCSHRPFALDAYAGDHFASSNLPIPAVLDLGWLDSSHAYCVSVRVAGRTLTHAKAAQMRLLLEPLTEVWRAVGCVDISRTSGYGHFDERGQATCTSWRGFLRAVLSDVQSQHASTAERIDRQLLRDLHRGFDSLIDDCPEERKLVHGDFVAENVLADKGVVTGLIDWAYPMYGDPLYDIATAHFWRLVFGSMSIPDDYWQTQLAALPGFRERTRCYALHLALVYLYGHTIDGEEWMLRRLHQRCPQLLRA
jgi:hygromycin-B 4-O-kinase